MNKDLEHLKYLSIGFYVYAGLTVLFSCFPFIHMAMGIAMVTGQFKQGANPPPPALGWFLIGIASTIILGGWGLSVALFLAGKFIKQQKRYTFCLVMAAISCLFAPLGTVLGVFTIIVLVRDSVKNLFNGQTYSNFSNVPPNWQ